MDYDMFFKWVSENAYLHAKTSEELKRVYDYLSKADMILYKIIRTNNWSLLKYFILFLTAGVSLSATDKYGYKKYQFPSWINLLSVSKKEREIVGNICLKIKLKCHLSAKKAHSVFLPFLKIIFQNNASKADKLAEYFEFTGEEVDWLRRVEK
jgi:replication factor C large subunit